jgi:hypothetical protein
MIQGGSGARRSRRARRIVTRPATYITLLRTQREIISLRDCARSMAWKPCVQKDAVVCSMTACYDSLTRCPRPIHVALVYTSTLHTHACTHARTHTHAAFGVKNERRERRRRRRDPSSFWTRSQTRPRRRRRPTTAVAPALRRGADASVPGTSRANVVPSRNAVSGASR